MLLELVYVSIYPCVAINDFERQHHIRLDIDKSNVTMESQPTEFISVCVAVLLELVYVFPSIHV